MASILRWVCDIFWTDRIWLAPGVKWADVTNSPDKEIWYPDVKDFWYTLPLTCVLIIGRYALENSCFVPLGRAWSVKDKAHKKLPDVPGRAGQSLETAYRRSPQIKNVTALAKQLDISERQVERWWRIRRYADKPSKLTKFCEHLWKAFICGFNCFFGLYILWDKDYYWNISKCFEGYPHQGITNDLLWYYMFNTAYMVCYLIMTYRDVRRKDFVVMQVHHVATLLLLFASWMGSQYRIGASLIPLQEATEALLEVAKAFKSSKRETATTITYIFFVLAWFIVRMYIFPVHILYGIYKNVPAEKYSFVLYLLVGLIWLIFFLQVYWTVLIVQVGINLISSHGKIHDVRSSSSEVSDSCNENEVNSDCKENWTKPDKKVLHNK